MSDLQKLIESVEAGKYHRECGLPRFTAMYEALGGPRRNIPRWGELLDAMAKGPGATAAILRALEVQP